MAKSYAERNAEAQEAGWESLYYQTQGRREAREALGDEVDRQTVWDYAEFERDFDAGMYKLEGEGGLRGIYEHYFGEDYDDSDFYDWLGELYDQIAG